MYELFGLVLHSKLFFLILILFVIYFYFKFIIYSFWRKLGVPHDEPTVPFGSVNSKFIMKKINMGKYAFNFINFVRGYFRVKKIEISGQNSRFLNFYNKKLYF